MESTHLTVQFSHKALDSNIFKRIFSYLSDPRDIGKCRLVSKEWNAEVKIFLQAIVAKLQKELLNYSKLDSDNLTSFEEDQIVSLLVKIRKTHQLLQRTPLIDKVMMAEAKNPKSHNPLIMDALYGAVILTIDNERWRQAPRGRHFLLYVYEDAPIDIRFYIGVPKENIESLDKFIIETPLKPKNPKQTKGINNLITWIYRARECAKRSYKLKGKMLEILEGLLIEVPDILVQQLGYFFNLKESCENEEVREKFAPKIEEYEKKIEKIQNNIRNQEIEIVTLRLAVQNLSHVLKGLHEKHKLEMWKKPKIKSKPR